MEHELITAVFNDDLETIYSLLRRGTDINLSEDEDSITALHFLAQIRTQNAFVLATQLVKLGANPNLKTVEGLTPLDLARLHENTFFIPWLEKLGETPRE